jgi:glycyl-tRNA synthetase beta chain
MESHQRYFPMEAEDGTLLPRFLVVHNGDPARTGAIIAGHERVIRARLADAAFFYHEDLTRPLEAYVAKLDTIVFHEKLGSLGAKVARIEALASALAEAVGAPADEVAYAARAAHLAKADLVTHAVIEFTSLQGVMGYRYAQAAGEAEVVAEVIVDHYRPRFAGDELPRSLAGKLVSIADKLDTIVGIFAIGQGPTGSADPYALRRSAIGILTMIIDGGVRLQLDEAIAAALAGYEGTLAGLDPNATGAVVKSFFDGRLEVMLRDRGYEYDVIEAVMAVASADPADTVHRVKAFSAFRQTEAGRDLSVAFRRVANLADPVAGDRPDHAIMGDEEGALADAVEIAYERVGALMTVDRDYESALSALADLRGPVDAFFDTVLVMDPDPVLRTNRLALLNRLRGLFVDFADFGKLAG